MTTSSLFNIRPARLPEFRQGLACCHDPRVPAVRPVDATRLDDSLEPVSTDRPQRPGFDGDVAEHAVLSRVVAAHGRKIKDRRLLGRSARVGAAMFLNFSPSC